MNISLINRQEVVSLADGQSGIDLVKSLAITEPSQALAMRLNGTVCDLATALKEGDSVELINFDSTLGKEIFWHTSAHILAQAVLRLFPNAVPTIGPSIENGFYYDFANLHLTEADLERIEKEASKVIKDNYRTKREAFESKEDALKAFWHNPFKVEIIENLEEGLTAYRQGEFFDLCRGPHLPFIGKVKAFKVLKTSSAYWRGDAEKESLTRIYGISFPDKQMLQEYMHQQEEARKRDHKVLGPKLGLFALKEEAPGLPFIQPKGMRVWNTLIDFWRKLHYEADYQEIKTPSLMTRELWEISGHWANYRENMYTVTIEEKDFAIKPMNCPGCVLYYRMHHYSYRQFPLRVAEIGHVHRYESSGALSGLMRVRGFHQDDAHIFMTPAMIEDEVLGVLTLLEDLYAAFGLQYHLELSTRPETNTIGTDEDWEHATESLRSALERSGKSFKINPGDGAFYGPKIDVHIRDAIGRTWQCGTIQLDMALPARFGIEYTESDGTRKTPIMIHRALFGSIERFFGILIEHFAGKFPLWLSPNQVRILTVADRHMPYAQDLNLQLKKAGFFVEVDDSNESIGKKVRSAQLDQVNYILTIGDKEVENNTIALRTRDNVVHGEMQMAYFLEIIRNEKENRDLYSPFSQKPEKSIDEHEKISCVGDKPTHLDCC